MASQNDYSSSYITRVMEPGQSGSPTIVEVVERGLPGAPGVSVKGDPGDPGVKGDPGDPGQPGTDGQNGLLQEVLSATQYLSTYVDEGSPERVELNFHGVGHIEAGPGLDAYQSEEEGENFWRIELTGDAGGGGVPEFYYETFVYENGGVFPDFFLFPLDLLSGYDAGIDPDTGLITQDWELGSLYGRLDFAVKMSGGEFGGSKTPSDMLAAVALLNFTRTEEVIGEYPDSYIEVSYAPTASGRILDATVYPNGGDANTPMPRITNPRVVFESYMDGPATWWFVGDCSMDFQNSNYVQGRVKYHGEVGWYAPS